MPLSDQVVKQRTSKLGCLKNIVHITDPERDSAPCAVSNTCGIRLVHPEVEGNARVSINAVFLCFASLNPGEVRDESVPEISCHCRRNFP